MVVKGMMEEGLLIQMNMDELLKGQIERERGKGERRERRHGKCGGVVVSAEAVPDTEDCPICAEVRLDYYRHGVIRASAGTPLAQELGLKVVQGKVGVVE